VVVRKMSQVDWLDTPRDEGASGATQHHGDKQ